MTRREPSPAVGVLARAVATAGGVGYLPLAPGTWGTAVAVPLAAALASLSFWSYAAVVIAATAVAIWAAGAADTVWGTHDSGRIVIDEVVGYLATVAVVDRTSFAALAVGFVLFRALDIIKPPPVRWIDRNMPGGAGVVLDDVAAGILGALLFLVARAIGITL